MVQLSDMKNIVVSKIIVTFICEILLVNVVYCIWNKETKQVDNTWQMYALMNLIRYKKQCCF
jgi:hypothetical protein